LSRTGSRSRPIDNAAPPAAAVRSLFVYPVKSCGGIEVTVLELGAAGPRFDREWAIVSEGGEVLGQSRFPTLCRIKPELTDSALVLRAPGLDPLAVPLDVIGGGPRKVRLYIDHIHARDQGDEAAAWLGAAVGQPVRLLRFDPAGGRSSRVDRSPKAFADLSSALLISEESLVDLNARLDKPVPMNRFRPNIVVAGCGPYDEDGWKSIRIGDTTWKGGIRCLRCRVTTTDQETGERSREPLKTLAAYRRHPARVGVMFGRYFRYVSGERVRVGDALGSGR
jgi:uncharacterized protein YcbX